MRVWMKSSKSGFTIVEMVTSLAILGIAIAVTYTVWITNWTSFEHHVTRADMWNEAGVILADFGQKGRESRQMNIQSNGKQLVMLDYQLAPIQTYDILADGTFQVTDAGGAVQVLSTFIDSANSGFEQRGRSVALELTMMSDVFGQPVSIHTASEVFPRN